MPNASHAQTANQVCPPDRTQKPVGAVEKVRKPQQHKQFPFVREPASARLGCGFQNRRMFGRRIHWKIIISCYNKSATVFLREPECCGPSRER